MSNQGSLPVFPGDGGDERSLGGAATYARWLQRLLPFLLDGILVAVVASIVARAMGFHDPTNVVHYHTVNHAQKLIPIGHKLVAWSVIDAVVGFVYATGFLSSSMQATPFMRLMGLTIARESDEGPVGLSTAAFRSGIFQAASILSSFVALIGFAILIDLLWPLWDKRRQTLHDKFARTVVLRRPRGR